MMGLQTFDDAVLLIDDEPYYLQWALDFLEDLGYRTVLCEDLDSALQRLERERYRAVIVDLSIPASQHLRRQLSEKGPAFEKYPGLLAADVARNRGHRDRQVVIYSVHDDDGVKREQRRLGCTYLLKGRPRQFKRELESVFSYDPTEDDSS